MPYRCVKCGGSHDPNKCQIPAKELNNEVITKTLTDGSIKKYIGVLVYCVLCKSEGNTANYKNCAFYQNLKKNLVEKKKQDHNKKPFVRKSVQNYRSSGTSCSDVLRLNNANPNTNVFNNNSLLNFINEECQNVFGQSFANIIFEINKFLPQYDKDAPTHIKQEKLFNLFFSICSGGSP